MEEDSQKYLESMGFDPRKVGEALSMYNNTEDALNWLLENSQTNSSFVVFNEKPDEEQIEIIDDQFNPRHISEKKEETLLEQIQNYRKTKEEQPRVEKKPTFLTEDQINKQLEKSGYTKGEIMYLSSFVYLKTKDYKTKVKLLKELREELPKYFDPKEIELYFSQFHSGIYNYWDIEGKVSFSKYCYELIMDFKSEQRKAGIKPEDMWIITPEIPIPKEKKTGNTHKLDELPDDTIVLILSYVDKSTVMNISEVSSTFNVARSNVIWRNLREQFVAYEENKAYLLPDTQKNKRLGELQGSMNKFTIKEETAAKVKDNQLRARRLEIEAKRENDLIEWQTNIFRYLLWFAYWTLVITCYCFSAIYLPLNYDFFNTSYYWLIGYIPLLIVSILHFVWMSIDAYKSGFYPFPRFECGGVTKSTPSFDTIIYFTSLLNSIPILVFISGLVLFFPGMKELRLTALFMTPVLLAGLWDVVTFIFVGIRVLLTLREDKDVKKWMFVTVTIGFIVTILTIIVTYIFYALSILFISLKFDQRIPEMPWSVIFIFPEITSFLFGCLLILFTVTFLIHSIYVILNYPINIGTSINKLVNFFDCNELCNIGDIDASCVKSLFDDEDELGILYYVAGFYALLLFTLATIWVSFIIAMVLTGLVLDGVFKTSIFLVFSVVFFGGLILNIVTVLSCLVVGLLCVCCVGCIGYCCLYCCFCICGDTDESCFDWCCYYCCGCFVDD